MLIEIGKTSVPAVALALRPLPRVRRVFNMCVFQGWDNAPAWMGERGQSTGVGITYDADNKPTIDVEAAVAYARTLPQSTLLSYDVEGNIVFPSGAYTKAIRYLHREVLKARPDLLLCQYAENCSFPTHDDYADWLDRVHVLAADDGVEARGYLDAGNIVAGQCYPRADTSDDDLDRLIARMVQAACREAKPGQLPGLWTTPADLFTRPSDTPAGYDRATPLSWRRALRIASRARLEGALVLMPWLYESIWPDLNRPGQNLPWETVFPQTYEAPLAAMVEGF